jgi:hypothetical protein
LVMTAEVFSQVPAKTAQEICKLYAPAPKALESLSPTVTPRQFYDLLLKQELWVEAGRFLAQALPKREAVWWACACVRQAAGPALSAADAGAVAAAEKWVTAPTEENRRAAHVAAAAAQGMDSPPGCVAMAAFWSGGSLAPKDQPAVPPAENLTGTAVVAALIHAAVLTEPDKFADKLRQFLSVGVSTAAGSNRWKEPTGAVPR